VLIRISPCIRPVCYEPLDSTHPGTQGHDVLAYFDHHASNGPTEAINGRLEALRRNALGFRNLTHYRIRSLLHCGNLAQQIDAL
ncbi:transposase, partial [Mycobacterium gordonae]|uniref:transposase n=1 Tax=Mycobacterium gordonae TaxID=1778 RepID=UPI001E3BC432